MIGRIKGKLAEINENVGLVETASGLSYEVFLPPALYSHPLNTAVEIETHLQVRDDAHILFGFKDKKDKGLFKLLLSVSGVGPKTAYQVTSYTGSDELISAVQTNDVAYFSKIPGLGKKTAMKIILELSQKLKSEFDMQKMNLSDEDKTVVDALMALGYKSQEAKQALSKISKGLSIEEKIKEALKNTATKK
jgi:Holliday junction DNA helicase RuvA